MTNPDEVRLDVLFYRLNEFLATTAIISLIGGSVVLVGSVFYAIGCCIVHCT